jgi:PhnB protein
MSTHSVGAREQREVAEQRQELPRVPVSNDSQRDVRPGEADAQQVAPIPEHLHTVTPRLVVSGAAEAIEFYGRAFGAEEIGERFTEPGGRVIHAELRLGDSVVMLTDEEGDAAPAHAPRPHDGAVSIILATYWEDVDAAWERAIAAGAEVIYPLADHFYGERGGRLRDPYGQQWMLSQRIEDLSHEQIAERAARLG